MTLHGMAYSLERNPTHLTDTQLPGQTPNSLDKCASPKTDPQVHRQTLNSPNRRPSPQACPTPFFMSSEEQNILSFAISLSRKSPNATLARMLAQTQLHFSSQCVSQSGTDGAQVASDPRPYTLFESFFAVKIWRIKRKMNNLK